MEQDTANTSGTTNQQPAPTTSQPTQGQRPRAYNSDRRGHFGSKKPGSRDRQSRDQRGRTQHQRPMRSETKNFAKKTEDKIPPLGDNIRIIPLGGVEEIGRNMTMVEYGDDIVIIDAGFQFQEDDTPGIDYILPNTKYLEDRKEKIRAVLITHGHLDHVGGIPYIMPRIGNPPMYTRNLTALMIKKRQEEFPHLEPLDIKVVEKDDTIQIGKLIVKFFAVTHTIPDSMGVIIKTPYGAIVHPGDPKLDHNDGVPTDSEDHEYSKLEKENVLLMMNDSTNVENPGFSTPEKLVHKNLDEIIKNIKGRLIIGTFASQLERMIKIIEVAEKYNKKIVIEGRSMKTNVEIATLANMLVVKKGTIISSQEIEAYPPDRIVILSTGAQGEEFAALMRMATKQHKNLKIGKRDTVLLSSSIIPGNEKSVQKLKDNLARLGAKIIHYRTSDVYIHSSGHGNRGELEWMFKKIKPKFFMPVHGNHYMLRLHAEAIENLGMSEENIIIPDNGTIIEIQEKGTKLVRMKEKAPSGMVMVDGFSIGNVQEVVLRDRQMLAQDGMFVLIASINTTTGKLKKSPDIISRGFVYLRESQDLLQQTRYIIKKTIEESVEGMHPINFDYVKQVVADNVSKYLFQQTAKRPIVIPVLLGV
ncbi:ribonuclease J [Patescibacteria group bacterium]|nr:ribonuclease J [Patescibacteria group bacterium]